MKRLLLLVCLWLCLGLSGHAALKSGTINDNSGPIPKNGDTALRGNLISIEIEATDIQESVDGVTVNIQNAGNVASASVTIGSNSFDTTSFSDGVDFDIIGGSSSVVIPSGNTLSFVFNLTLKETAVIGEVVTLNVVSIGTESGSNLPLANKKATVTVSGFQGVTVNSVVSESKILAGHANFPVLNVEVGPMVGEGLNSGLSVGVKKNPADNINGVRLCLDVDKNKSIDNLSSCGTTVQFSGNQATPNLNNSILDNAGSTTNVLVVYDLSTSTPNSSLNPYKAEVSTVSGTGNSSNQEISETETAFSGSGHNLTNLDLVGVVVNATDTPTGDVIPGNVTNDMLIIEVTPVGVSVNVANLNIGSGEGVEFQNDQNNKVKSIHIFDGTSLSSAYAFTSSGEATVTLNKQILSGDDTNFTIQYVLPVFTNNAATVQAVVKETSEFQVTVNGTAYIANSESGTENFKVFNLPIASDERSVSDVDDKVVLRSVTPKTNDSVFVGQQNVPVFELEILNNKEASVMAELTVNATDEISASGFNVGNQGIVGISVLNDSGNSVGFLSVPDSSSDQTIQFLVSQSANAERYTIGVNVGQNPDAVKAYTLRLDSIPSGIDVVKDEDINKQTNFSVATYNLDASFDSFVSNVATITVTNNTGATVTLNSVSLSTFQDSLGGNVVALSVTPSENVVILSGQNKTIVLSVDEVFNAEAMDVVFLPIIQATVSGNAVLLSRYRTNDTFTSPFQTNTRGIRRSFSANTSVEPSLVHIDRIEVKKDDDVIGEFLNGDAVTPNSRFFIHMRNPSLWNSVQVVDVSAPHSGSDKDYDAETGQLEPRKFLGSGSFSLRVTPTDGSPFSIPIRFLMSRSLAASDPLLYPNPYNTAGGDSLQVAINTTAPSDVDITVYDMRGRPVISHNQSVPLGYSNVTIPSTRQLASGMYLAYVVIKSNGESVKKVVRLAVY